MVFVGWKFEDFPDLNLIKSSLNYKIKSVQLV